MAKAFVAIDEPLHHLLRVLTRRTPLVCIPGPEGGPLMQYQIRPEELPAGLCGAVLGHALGGVPWGADRLAAWSAPFHRQPELLQRAGYLDAVRLDRRCCRDLRLKMDSTGRGLMAADLLACGTGVLQARNDNPAEVFHQYLWGHYGRLRSRHAATFALLRTLHRNSLGEAGALEKESYESTNVIYGDAYGELEQLWERRADTAFLDLVARSLSGARRQGHLAGFVQPPLHLDGLKDLHLRAQALWRTPPASGRALLRRLDYLLSHTVIDSSPATVFERQNHCPASPPWTLPARRDRPGRF